MTASTISFPRGYRPTRKNPTCGNSQPAMMALAETQLMQATLPQLFRADQAFSPDRNNTDHVARLKASKRLIIMSFRRDPCRRRSQPAERLSCFHPTVATIAETCPVVPHFQMLVDIYRAARTFLAAFIVLPEITRFFSPFPQPRLPRVGTRAGCQGLRECALVVKKTLPCI